MAKSLSSVIGVDIGRFSLKSVLLQKKSGDRFAVTHCASQVRPEGEERTSESVARELKSLLKNMGGKAKAIVVALSSPESLVRIVDQPETPTEVLREMMRINSHSLLNQDCRNYILDCDQIPTPPAENVPGQRRYLVAGLPRAQVEMLTGMFDQAGMGGVSAVQLAPLSVFNAFDFAQPETFNNQAFFLLDLGHATSTMILGVRRELVLLRNIEFGGGTLIDTICSLSGENRPTVIRALAQDDEVMVENARVALMGLTREIGSSIGFFEGRRDDTIAKVWVSGGLARHKTVLRVLAEELRMPCVAWGAAEKCEINVSSNKRAAFEQDLLDYSVACGAAVQLLNA